MSGWKRRATHRKQAGVGRIPISRRERKWTPRPPKPKKRKDDDEQSEGK